MVGLNLSSNCDLQSLLIPLHSPYENSPNPCFVGLVTTLVHATVALFGLIQLIQVLNFNSFGPFPIKYSFGTPFNANSAGKANLVKLGCLIIHVTLVLLLFTLSFASCSVPYVLLSLEFMLLAIVIPLHLAEITRSIIPHASLLIFWIANFLVTLTWVLQDCFASYKLFVNKSLKAECLTIELILLLNSFSILVLEANFKPTVELIDYFELNEWNYSNTKSFLSDILISWVEPVMDEIHDKKKLDAKIVPDLDLDMKANYCYKILVKNWNKQLKKSNPSLFWAIMASFWREIAATYLFNLFDIIIGLMQPFLLQQLLLYFGNATSDTEIHKPLITGISIVIGIFGVTFGRTIAANRSFMVMYKFMFRLQSALSCLVFDKALRLAPEVRKDKSTGDIVNHLATDISSIDEMSMVFTDFINNPIYLVLCLVSLFKIIGNATWGGIATAVILVPLSTKVTSAIYKYFEQASACKDDRIQLTSEILNSIKSVKLYSWENSMLDRLDEVRNEKELTIRRKLGIYNAFSTFMWSCIPFFISCTSFGTFVWISDIPLTPEKIFPAMALFDLLSEPLLLLPNVLSDIAEISVAIERLRKFFLLPDIKSYVKRTYKDVKPGALVVTVENSTFTWEEGSDNIALKDINLQIPIGNLICVVGRLGSGKTTLLRAILGEIPCKKSKELSINGSIAYCTQSPWILNSSVKDNITFGSKFNKKRYLETIKVCELESDFKSLPDADETMVGEKGISLSGGQKARLSLARAVYADSDIYLLDDILSAVDAHVGKNLIKNVLSKLGVLGSKTIILATNSVAVLPNANEIIYLQGGEIVERGDFNQLLAQKGLFEKLVREHVGENDSEFLALSLSEGDNEELDSSSESVESVQEYHPPAELETGLELSRTRSRANSEVSFPLGASTLLPEFQELERDQIEVEEMRKMAEAEAPKRTGQSDEIISSGQVKLGIYMDYFRACNYSYIIFYVVLVGISIGLTLLGNYTLKYWSEQNEELGRTSNPVAYLGFYAFFGIMAGVCTLVSAFIVWTYCILRGSKHFHDLMAYSILRSPMSFFETTPIGRILNRFSEDIGQMDNNLPWVMIDLLELVLDGLTVFIVIVYNVPLMIFVIFGLLYIYNNIRKYFIPTSRELKRLMSARKSPIFAILQESVTGVESLRAYEEVDVFMTKNEELHDSRISANYFANMANRWLSIRLNLIAAVMIGFSALLVILSIGTRFQLSTGLVGFVMSYALKISFVLRASVRRWAEVEARSVSIERIVEYCDLKPEAPLIIPENRPQNWPSEGEIVFSNYSTRYRENLDPVLKNIDLNIKAGEKIGIVGRTGAGKSSLTLAIFRIIEATTGNINIDKINTSEIGLADLRSNLSIIPQDAHTIEGSVKQNLDPFGKYTDEELWKALELAHLKDHILSMDNDGGQLLDVQIYEGGSNLSAGQKQLLCLARALLNSSKILVLDEATAAVDVQTDKIIQETIRNEFKDRTILTIAHRLDTIMDSDRIVVLEKGTVKEFAPVDELLANPDSVFRHLCEEGGYIKPLSD